VGSFVGPAPGVDGSVPASREAPPSSAVPEPDEVVPPELELEPAPDDVDEFNPPEPLELPLLPEAQPELSLPPDEPLELSEPSSDDGLPPSEDALLPPHAASTATQANPTQPVAFICTSRRIRKFIVRSTGTPRRQLVSEGDSQRSAAAFGNPQM
jgi:hypothetical protein